MQHSRARQTLTGKQVLTSTSRRRPVAALAALQPAAPQHRPSLCQRLHHCPPPAALAAAHRLLLRQWNLLQVLPPPQQGWLLHPAHAAPPAAHSARAPAVPPGPGTWRWSQCCPADGTEPCSVEVSPCMLCRVSFHSRCPSTVWVDRRSWPTSMAVLKVRSSSSPSSSMAALSSWFD